MAKILIVDDQRDNLELLFQILEDSDYNVVEADNGYDAIRKAEEEMPDVILLDIQMPEMDGFEVCSRLKKNDSTREIPIIFLTAQTGEESVVKGLQMGAYDYVTKPFKESELLARISVMLRISQAEKNLKEIAVTDPLTGINNRRFLFQRFNEEISRAKRKNIALSCMMIDIDYFKKINDTYGHDFGDFVLVETAQSLKENIRVYDTLARYGGEEFLIILPGEDEKSAGVVAEKIRAYIDGREFVKNDLKVHVAVSIGVFGVNAENLKNFPEEYIKCADIALYAAKSRGRNKVVLYSDIM